LNNGKNNLPAAAGKLATRSSPDAIGCSRATTVIEELKADDMIVVNPLSEIVRSLPGFELFK